MAKWEQLIAARDGKHLSQLEAAEIVNVGAVTYQRWELGRAKPQPKHMRRLYEVFGTMLLDHGDVACSHELPSHETVSKPSPLAPVVEETLQETISEPSPLAPVIEEPPEERPIAIPAEETDDKQTRITIPMTTHLWSLACMNHPTSNDRRNAIRQAIKEFDTMNTTNKNYQITRREALCSLATFPMITMGLTTAGSTVQPAQYGDALAHCAASVEACWELRKSSEASDLVLAFKSASKYLPILETIARNSSQYRKEALDLATRYTLIKAYLGRHCVGLTEAIQYAKDAITLSKETGDISLQLSAYSKLAWSYFFDKKYILAEKTMQEAEMLLQRYNRLPSISPLHPSVQGHMYSGLALMLAKNGRSPDVALGKAIETGPGNECISFVDFKYSNLLLNTGWTYCSLGNQAKAMEALEQRVDPETLTPKILQSELGRVETINVMALSSLRTRDRDMEKAIHLWTAGIAGAKALQSEQRFNEALTTYELMEVVWSGDARIKDLRDYIVHW